MKIKRPFDFSRYGAGGDLESIPSRLKVLPPGAFDLLKVLFLAAIAAALWQQITKL